MYGVCGMRSVFVSWFPRGSSLDGGGAVGSRAGKWEGAVVGKVGGGMFSTILPGES